MSEVDVKKRLATVVLIGLVSFTIGCTFSYPVDRNYLVSERFPPKSADYPISVLSEKPKCPYQEIAHLTTGGGTRDKNIKLMEEETRRVGGDAVFLIHLWSGDFPNPDARLYGSTGLVLMWLEEDCRE